jgi:hypothetical protein
MAEQYIKSILEDKAFRLFQERHSKWLWHIFHSHILLDYSEEKGIDFLKNIYKSLANDGVLVISEWLLNDEKTGPASAALMGLNMIIETYGGKNYSNAEIVGKLNQAGFKRSERRSLRNQQDIIIGYKS